MKKISFAISICLFFCMRATAQISPQQTDAAVTQYLNLPTILPPSPDVASIQKFGNIPVDYSTGVPSISIPMFTIKCGSLSWPVSISYNSSGIKVDEVSSSVGLGWALMAPGVITRSVIGKPDEFRTTYVNWDTVTYRANSFLYNVLGGSTDSELDIFSYSFNGRSGKFMVRQDGSVFQIPYTNLKITNNGFNSFTIVDENGITYSFDQLETQNFQTPMQGYGANFKSSWYLSKAALPDTKQEIDFSYTAAGTNYSNSFSFTQNVGGNWQNGAVSNTTIFQAVPVIHQTAYSTNVLILSKITFPNGYLQFDYTNSRTDINGTAAQKLKDVAIYQTGSTAQLVKTYKFSQSYFYYRPPSNDTGLIAQNRYRLKLDTVKEVSGDLTTQNLYTFDYNLTPMMPRESYGQDKWGFNNGIYTNTSLIQDTLVTLTGGAQYSVGTSHRNVDTSKMKACVLTAVHWPTGGKTAFQYEAHKFQTGVRASGPFNEVVRASPTATSASLSFTYPATQNPGNPRLIVQFNAFPNTPVPSQKPYVTLVDQANPGQLIYIQQGNPSANVNIQQAFPSLLVNHSYTISAYVFPNAANPSMQALLQVQWDTTSAVTHTDQGGGLRVKEVRNYDNNGTVLSDDFYQYNIATTATPYNFINKTYDEIDFRNGDDYTNPATGVSTGCIDYYASATTEARVYHSASVYPMSTISGSPILYSDVLKFTKNSSGTDIGKTESTYDIVQDDTWPYGNQHYQNSIIISNEWLNGGLLTQTQYKNVAGVYKPVQVVTNNYNLLKTDFVYSLKVSPSYIETGCDVKNQNVIASDLVYSEYPTYTGSKKLMNKITTTYDDNGNGISDTVNYQYLEPTNDFVTQTTENDSYGAYRISQMKYPADSSSTPVYNSMIQKNIVSPVIQQQNLYQAAGSTSQTATEVVKTHYKDWNENGLVLKPDYVQYASYTNPIEPRVKYTGYDDHGNALSVQKVGGPQISYIWGFNKQYPIAQVINSDSLHIAYTGFEDGTTSSGHWHFTSSGVTSSVNAPLLNIRSGTWAYKIASGAVTASVPAGTFIISYWGTAAASVNSAAPSVTGDLDTRGWQYFEHTVTLATAGSITVSGTGTTLVDELRLYPAGSQMVSYTYNPLVGVTSIENKDGHNLYYDYDYLQRLTYVRDDHRSILKEYKYNYANSATLPVVTTWKGTDSTCTTAVATPNLANYTVSDHLANPGPPPVPTAGVVFVVTRTETNYNAFISITTRVSSGSPATYNFTIPKGSTTGQVTAPNEANNITGWTSPITVTNTSGATNNGMKTYQNRIRLENGIPDGYKEANTNGGGMGPYFPPVTDTTFCN